MYNKAGGLTGCFRIFLLAMASGLNLSLKANSGKNLLVMKLPENLAFITPFGGDMMNTETRKVYVLLGHALRNALHELMAKLEMASVDVPVFVFTDCSLAAGKGVHAELAVAQKTSIADIFGVEIGALDVVNDMGKELEVQDPYMKKFAWPLRGYKIARGKQWHPNWMKSVVLNDIFILSSKNFGVDPAMEKQCLLARVVELALLKATKDDKNQHITVHIIGQGSSDLVGQSGRNVLFACDDDNSKPYTLQQVNARLNCATHRQSTSKICARQKVNDGGVKIEDLLMHTLKHLTIKPVHLLPPVRDNEVSYFLKGRTVFVADLLKVPAKEDWQACETGVPFLIYYLPKPD
eukprot:GHVS01051985.1.p1 GENE.GHVS01051985.1~~GHVS01051985.1.p1  ORF type:complete len:350 (-),score=36.18 GHVS01051985.1:49-1098(-)